MFVIAFLVMVKARMPDDKTLCMQYTFTHYELKILGHAFFHSQLKLSTAAELNIETIEYVKKREFGTFVDKWGSSYKFKLIDDRYTLYSFGKNSTDDDGSNDDIVINNLHNRGIYCNK
jgi:hypothetical protein